jgi:protein involved in polysaccharide export with SLBB domain
MTAPLVLLVCGCALVPPKSFLDPTKVGIWGLDYQEGGIRRVLTPKETPAGVANAADPTPEDLVPNLSERTIEPSDVVSISIEDFVTPGVTYAVNLEVSPSGFVRLPQGVGPIKAVGLTEADLEKEIRTRVQEAGVVREPVVQTVLARRANQIFSIVGSVVQVSAYPITQPDLRLLDAIAIARGIGPEVRKLYVIRQSSVDSAAKAATSKPAEATPASHEREIVIPPPEEEDGGNPYHGTLFARAGLVGQESAPAPTPLPETSDLESVLGPRRGAQTQTATAPEMQRPFAPLIFDETTGALKEAPPASQTEPTTSRAAGFEEEKKEFDWNEVPEYELSQRVISIDVRALNSGDPKYNIVVRDRDVIQVPQDVSVFYLMGEVNRPGVFAFNGREVTIKQAVAVAGGFTALAWPARCEVIRREPGSDRQTTIPVNLDKIFAGLDQDFLLRDDDIVNVGTDFVAPFLFVIRNSFRFTYGFGFVYDRNFADKDAYNARINPQQLRISRRQSLGLPF